MRIVLTMVLAAASIEARAQDSAATSLCFDEFRQVYEWDDGGFDWRTARAICGNELSNDPGASARTQGRIEVLYHHGDVRVVSSTSRWMVEHGEGRPCASARRSESIETKTLRAGRLTIVKTKDGREVQRAESAAHPNAMLSIAGMPRVPPTDAHLAVLGQEAAFGYSCQRLQPRANPAMTMCALPVASSCKSRSALQPIEFQVVQPGGNTLIHQGRTTEFRAGDRGIVDAREIQAP